MDRAFPGGHLFRKFFGVFLGQIVAPETSDGKDPLEGRELHPALSPAPNDCCRLRIVSRQILGGDRPHGTGPNGSDKVTIHDCLRIPGLWVEQDDDRSMARNSPCWVILPIST